MKAKNGEGPAQRADAGEARKEAALENAPLSSGAETAKPAPSWRDPFNPETGAFRDNIRAAGEDDLTELRESMQRFGWNAEFPALMDEHGVVLVGHRRMKVAAELGITPVIRKLTLGSGDAADAERLKLAIISNVGGKPMTKEDRKRIAAYLYGEQAWTMERIGEALNVSTRTVSSDLDGFEVTSKPPRPKGGRPKGIADAKPRKQPARKRVEAPASGNADEPRIRRNRSLDWTRPSLPDEPAPAPPLDERGADDGLKRVLVSLDVGLEAAAADGLKRVFATLDVLLEAIGRHPEWSGLDLHDVAARLQAKVSALNELAERVRS